MATDAEIDRIIAEAFGRRRAATAPRTATEISEADLDNAIAQAFGRAARSNADVEAKCREVGLCEADARIAARGLQEGRYVSFADAVASRVMFDVERRNRVDKGRLQEISEAFEGKDKQ